MEFLVKFSEKPMNTKRKMAIELAKKCNATFENGFYLVRFNEINQNLRDLFRLSNGWSTSDFVVDGCKDDIDDVRKIIYCYRGGDCDGHCHIGNDYYLSLDRIVRNFEQYKLLESGSRLWRVDQAYTDNKFLSMDPEKIRITVHKNIIFDFLKKEFQGPLKYCNMITEEKLQDIINHLPDSFTLTPRQEIEGQQKGSNREYTDEEYDDDESEEYDEDYYEEEGEFEGLSDYQIAKLEAMAEVVAPIFARAFMDELSSAIQTCTEEIYRKNKNTQENIEPDDQENTA